LRESTLQEQRDEPHTERAPQFKSTADRICDFKMPRTERDNASIIAMSFSNFDNEMEIVQQNDARNPNMNRRHTKQQVANNVLLEQKKTRPCDMQ